MLTMAGLAIAPSSTCSDHGLGDLLGQEKRPAEVDIHDLVVGGLAHLQQVDALARGHARVVDQQIDPPKSGQRLIDHPLAVVVIAHIGLDDQPLAPRLSHQAQRLIGSRHDCPDS